MKSKINLSHIWCMNDKSEGKKRNNCLFWHCDIRITVFRFGDRLEGSLQDRCNNPSRRKENQSEKIFLTLIYGKCHRRSDVASPPAFVPKDHRRHRRGSLWGRKKRSKSIELSLRFRRHDRQKKGKMFQKRLTANERYGTVRHAINLAETAETAPAFSLW